MGILDKARAWRKQRQEKRQNKQAKKIEENLPLEAGPKYSLLKQIKKTPWYKESPAQVDGKARSFLESHGKKEGAGKIVPGQLIIFDYFEPKTKEDLEYYDASPCTIFFNVVNTKEGKRVLGFNLHYYPPRMRQQILSTIFTIFKPIYSKYFVEGTRKSVEGFDYKYLINSLERAGLGFGVRMYIPNLIARVKVIPPQMWHLAVFTEGWFKKQTREAVMKHWKEWMDHH